MRLWRASAVKVQKSVSLETWALEVGAHREDISSFQWLVLKWMCESMQAGDKQPKVCWRLLDTFSCFSGLSSFHKDKVDTWHVSCVRNEKSWAMKPEPVGSIVPQTCTSRVELFIIASFKSFGAGSYEKDPKCDRITSSVHLLLDKKPQLLRPWLGNGNLLQYCCLKNPMDRGAWCATVHGLAESWARMSTHAERTCPPSAAT